MTARRLIAVYGGTFDPVHRGHITIARRLIEIFSFDEFIFLPAFHAPHKPDSKPTSAFHRFAMLALATKDQPRMSISTVEFEHGRKRYTVDSLPEIGERFPEAKVFFIMGADSWRDITTWRDWEKVLLMTDHVVVTRPGYDIGFDHVTDDVRDRIIDLRRAEFTSSSSRHIYITDAVELDVSATEIRGDVREDERLDREEDVPKEVAKYIEKYELYK